MKQIWNIFKRDVRRLCKNRFALIVTIGIIVIPSLYAWFNIGANYDPYSNTKGIKVAVANEDKMCIRDSVFSPQNELLSTPKRAYFGSFFPVLNRGDACTR